MLQLNALKYLLAFAINTHFIGSFAQGPEHVGCFVDQALANGLKFTISPGGYDPNVLSPSACAASCQVESYKYAGLQEGKFCFCSDIAPTVAGSICNSSCSQNTSESLTCGGKDLYTDVYIAFAAVPLKGLALHVNNATVTTGQSVTFTSSLQSGSGVRLRMTYGDGSPQTSENATAYMNHVYYLPGRYSASIYASDDFQPTKVITDHIDVFVNQVVEDLLLDCPKTAKPNEEFVCTINLVKGTNADLSIDMGDGSGQKLFKIPAPKFGLLGHPVPQTQIDYMKSGSMGTLSLLGSIMSNAEGYIVAIEAYTTSAGSISFQVVKPTCSSGQFCFGTKSCEASCPNGPSEITCATPGVLCPAAKSCSDRCNSVLPDQFVQVASYNAVLDVGFNHIDLKPNEYMKVLPGYMLAFDSSSGIVAYRNVTDEEEALGIIDQTSSSLSGPWTFSTLTHLASGIISYAANVQIQHSYQSTGRYTVSVECSNNIPTRVQNTSVIDVDVPVAGLDLTLTATSAISNVPFSIKATLENGSDITFTWIYGDNTNATTFQNSTTPGEIIVNEHTYTTDGDFEIIVIAENVVSSVNESLIVAIQNPVTTQWAVTSDSPIVHPPGTLTLHISWSGSGAVPTSPSYSISWGDGTNDQLGFPNTTTEVVTSHNYTSGGVFNCSVFICNLLSNHTAQITVEVFEKIQGLSAQVFYANTDVGPKMIKGRGTMGEIVTKNSNVSIVMSKLKGTVTTYMVENNAGTLLMNQSESTIPYYVGEPGFYNLSIYGWNRVQGKSAPLSIALIASDEFSDVIIDDFFVTTDAMMEKTFQINLGTIGSESCALIDFGDQTDLDYSYPVAYGVENICFENYTYDDIDYKGLLTDPMNVTHVYQFRGIYKISVQLFATAQSLKSETSMIFSVTNFSCPTPQIVIKDSRTILSQPKTYMKSESFRIDTDAVISCDNVTINSTRSWCIVRIDEFGGELENINVSSLTSSNKSAFFVPGGFLSYGIYKIVYLLSLSATGMDSRYPFCHSVFTYVEIIQTPYLIGKMTNDVSTRLIRGLKQHLQLGPANFSIDPDFPNDKDFNVTWFCRRLLPNEEILPTNGTSYDTSNLLKIPSSKPISDDGGCFGTGPGAIDIPQGYWIMDTSVLYNTGMVFEISAIVSKSNRKAEAKIEIETIDGNPPCLSISCQNEGLCFPSESGTIINPTTRLALIASCEESCDDQLLYDWKLLDSGTGLQITDGELYMIGHDTYNVAIKKDFFGNNTGITDAVFQVTASRESDGFEGLTRMRVILNAPPVGGVCSMTPSNGVALLDKFQLSCAGWSDPEGGPITRYTFSAINANGTEQILSFDSESTKSVILPYGTLDIIVKISDEYGAITEYYIEQDVEIVLPTREEYEQFLNSTALSNIVCGGNQQEICQVFAAIASIQNSGLLIPTSSGNETTDAVMTYDYQATMGKRITYLIEALHDITAESLPSMEMIASTLSLIVANGDAVDLNGKKLAVKQLENLWASLETNVAFTSPQAARQFAQSSISVMGGVATAVMNTVINGEILPSDLNNVNNIVYDTAVGDDYDFEMPTSLDEMHVAAIQADTSHQGRNEIISMTNMVKVLSAKILEVYVADEEPMTIETQSDVTVTIGKFVGSNLSSIYFQQKDAYFQFPGHCHLLALGNNCKGNESVGVSAILWPGILQSFAKNTDSLSPNTRTLELDIYDADNKLLKITNTTEPIHMIIPRNLKSSGYANNASELLEPTEVIPSLAWNEFMMYHQFNVTNPDAAVNIEITPRNLSMRAIVMLRYSRKPTLFNYDFSMRLVDIDLRNGTFYLFLSNDILNNKTGIFYLGIVEISPELSDANYSTNASYSFDMVTRNFSCTYSLRIFTSGCYYYDEIRKQWLGRGCYVHAANYSMTYCMCTHLTSFGSGFFVMPNTVDFSYVFSHADFNDNLTVYVTMIITFLIYLLLLIWARWKDTKDVEKLGAAPLPDNKTSDKYIYEILIFTGNKANAATDSTVHFVLSGEKDETEVRVFGDDKRKIFRKGDMNAFIMTVPRPLGSLHFMRIWHDNSGKGQYASWYLNFIIVRDIQTGEEFNFIGDQWWAVEEGDGQIDRLVPVAGKEQMRAFSHVFSTSSQNNLADGHLWFSIFMRPPRSRFTRVQRVSCCVAFLYLTMLVNAMWYGTSVDSPNTSGFKIGPFSLTTEQIGVGFISNLIVFLPNFVIVFLFRKSRPRKLRPSRVNDALSKQSPNTDNDSKSKKLLDNTSSETSSMGSKAELIKDDNSSVPKVAPIPEKKFTLPWFFVILAWLLVIATIAASVFFLWAYGIQFGNEKTKKWITSLVLSFFASVFITQPIKVFLIALLFSAICKKVDDDADDADEDEVDPLLYSDEEWLHGKPSKKRSILIRPLNPEYLKKAREERLKEIKMWAVLKEVFAYMMFLWVLIVISYGNRDPNGYFLKQTLEGAFVQDGQDNGFNNIRETKGFWIWARDILVPNLRAQKLYNDIPPFGLRGFLKDQVNRLMGYAVIRQIRYKPDACSPPKEMRNKSTCTGLFTNFVHEDRKNYGLGWNDTFEVNFYTDVTDTEFQYQSANALDGYPTIGALDIYSGGGYVIKLQGAIDDIIARLTFLEENQWIDRHTRAVYIEFSVYNAQVNLFGVASMWVEFFAGGGATPHYRFDGIKLLYYYRNFGLFLLICEVVYVLFILYFTFREMRELCRQKKKYFKSYWSYAEIGIILISYAAIGVYIYRKVVTQNLLQKFNETKGNGYIKLQFVYSLDEIYGYLLAFVVFMATLKFNKLLRFNKRMGMLSSTLSHACGDLAWFGLSFIIIFLAFVQLFYLLLTTHMVDFSDFISAIEYCLTMMLQKFDLSRINSACPVLGTVAFFFFSLITTIILINLFLTIVIKAFEEVSHDMAKQSNEYELVDFIKKRFAAYIGISRSVPLQQELQPQLKSNNVKKNDKDKNVGDLPEKVDQLLEYINVQYFEGKMKLEEQTAMKGMFSRPKTTYSDTN